MRTVRTADAQDVVCSFNHDPDSFMGRIVSGTLRLSVDGVGLKYEADLPKTTDTADCAELVGRGDIPGSSFSFMTRSVAWQTADDGTEYRILQDVDLIDVGPVTWPAYNATTTGIPSDRATVESELAEYRGRREADAVNVRSRLVAIGSESV